MRDRRQPFDSRRSRPVYKAPRATGRPSFDRAAAPDAARPLLARFAGRLSELGLPVETGVFGARMEVELVNDGPVTFVLAEGPRGEEG